MSQQYQESSKYPHLHISQHPFAKHKLSLMRDKNTNNAEFRKALHDLSLIIAYEATMTLQLKEKQIHTPITQTTGYDLPEIVIVPILRAGLGMAAPIQTMIPQAAQGHIGMYRDHITKEPVDYLFKMPEVKNQIFMMVDPMLATGGTAIASVTKLLEHGVKKEKIMLLAIVLAPEGVKKFYEIHPTIPIFAASLDEKLNDDKYIVPGLGDCGDRLFGTK
jgi:uracil phosphoribosyltransferase